jgi:hypothetical protein
MANRVRRVRSRCARPVAPLQVPGSPGGAPPIDFPCRRVAPDATRESRSKVRGHVTRVPSQSQAEGIRHTSPWFNPGRNDQATDTQPQAEPKASHIPAHGSTMGETTISPTPYPSRAEGIRHTSPWFNHGRNDHAADSLPQAKPKASGIPAHGSTLGETTRPPIPNPKPSRRHHTYQPMVQPWAKRPFLRHPTQTEPKASGIPAHGSTLGETTRPPKPTPSRAEGIRHISPWFNPGRNDQATDTLPQAKPKASGIPAHGSTMGETTMPPTPYPKPSRRHHTYQPVGNPRGPSHGRNEGTSNTLPQAKPKASQFRPGHPFNRTGWMSHERTPSALPAEARSGCRP